MNFSEKLVSTADKFNSIVCLGLDPVIEKIPMIDKSIKRSIYVFFENILNEMESRNVHASAVKPNYAFYAQYGIDGIEVLVDVIKIFKKSGYLVILDSKRGDIGYTSEAYSRESFEFFNADAVTLSPYMGYDTIKPFVEKYPEKGLYILCRTSNSSSIDFQNLLTDNMPLYMKVAEKICTWNNGFIGAVVGATYPRKLHEILQKFINNNQNIPLLIPGVGSQGGDPAEITDILMLSDSIKKHRINSSSGILYAYEKNPNLTPAEASINELIKLNTITMR